MTPTQRAAALIVLVVVAVVGCGGDGNTSPERTPTASPSVTATASQTPTPTISCIPRQPTPADVPCVTCGSGDETKTCFYEGSQGFCIPAQDQCECFVTGETPTATPVNVCPLSTSTPSPTPIGAITYRLAPYRGSWITEYLPTGVSVGRPLEGSLTVVPSGPVEGNHRFHFSIIDFHFDSVTQQIRGHSGAIEAPASTGAGRVEMRAAVAINGEDIALQGDEPLSSLADYPPSILYMEICGAANSAVTCADLHTSDYAGYSVIFSAEPDVPQTPIPTPTATPIVPVRYLLTEGSALTFRSAIPGAPLFEPDPLSGSFTMVRCASPPPNTLFLYTITEVDIRSDGGRAISGASVGPVWCASDAGTGSLQALTFSPGISLYAVLSVDGDVVAFNGGLLTDNPIDPPLLQGLEACGVSDVRSVSCAEIRDGRDYGYDMVIFAKPQELPLGASCTASSDCASSYCIDGQCCDNLCSPEFLSCRCDASGIPSFKPPH